MQPAFVCMLMCPLFIRGNDFDNNTVGQAYLDTMCSANSVGVVQDIHSSVQSTGSTFAHEVGHILSLEHDTREFHTYPTSN